MIDFALPGSLSLCTQIKNLEVLLEVVERVKKGLLVEGNTNPQNATIFFWRGGGWLYLNMEKILRVKGPQE